MGLAPKGGGSMAGGRPGPSGGGPDEGRRVRRKGMMMALAADIHGD
jgi:hypothetical protein